MMNYFEKGYTVTPEACDSRAMLSPIGIFNLFQGMATIHAEQLGVGGAAMAARDEFWLTVHTRVDIFDSAALMEELTAKTWPNATKARDLRSYRSYLLKRGEQVVAAGKTEWAVLGGGKRLLRFGESGFPEGFEFLDETAIEDKPRRFADDFTDEDKVYDYTVCSTDIDFGKHMNNVAYVRVLLGSFKAEQLSSGFIKGIEIHYSSSCYEGEKLTVFMKEGEGEKLMSIKKENGETAVLASIRTA